MAATSTRTRALLAGLETYDLEITAGVDQHLAAGAAITAAARVHENEVLRRISRAALVVSASLLAQPRATRKVFFGWS